MSPRATAWIALVLLAPATSLLPGVLLAPQASAWQCMPDPGGVCEWVQDHVYFYAKCVVAGSFECVVVVVSRSAGVAVTVCIDEDGVRVSRDRTCSAHGEADLLS